MKKVLQFSQMPRLIMIITIVVMIGGLIGTTCYLLGRYQINNFSYDKSNKVISKKEALKIANRIFSLECDDKFFIIEEYQLTKKNIRNLPDENICFGISDYIMDGNQYLYVAKKEITPKTPISNWGHTTIKKVDVGVFVGVNGDFVCGIAYGSYEEPRYLEIKNVCKKPQVDFYSCSQNSDCIPVNNRCCGCTMGGSVIAINKKFKDVWHKKLNCKEIICPTVMSNDPSCFQEPKCENNKCVLMDTVTL